MYSTVLGLCIVFLSCFTASHQSFSVCTVTANTNTQHTHAHTHTHTHTQTLLFAIILEMRNVSYMTMNLPCIYVCVLMENGRSSVSETQFLKSIVPTQGTSLQTPFHALL